MANGKTGSIAEAPPSTYSSWPVMKLAWSVVLEDGSGVPMTREAFLQGSALVVRLQPCDLESMSNGQLVLIERLFRFGNQSQL
jgi:hypothetical protein